MTAFGTFSKEGFVSSGRPSKVTKVVTESSAPGTPHAVVATPDMYTVGDVLQGTPYKSGRGVKISFLQNPS